MRKNYKLLIGTLSSLLLMSCGGGTSSEMKTSDELNSEIINGPDNDSQNNDQENVIDIVLTGVFIDSPVEGLTYTTESQSGTTNKLGEFKYIEGESITFSIGDLTFPEVNAESKVTPADLAVGSDDWNATAVNIARLLQSLDSDSNTANGIEILSIAAQSTAKLDFDVSVSSFAENTNVINLLANSGSTNSSLIDENIAIQHINESAGTSLTPSVSLDSDRNVDLSTFPELATLTTKPFSARYWKGTSAFDIHGLSIRFDVAEGTGTIRSNGENVIGTSNGACLVPHIDASNAIYLGYKEEWQGERILVEHDINNVRADVRELILKNVNTGEKVYFFNGRQVSSDLCIDPDNMEGALELQKLTVGLYHPERGSIGQLAAWFVDGISILNPVDWKQYL